MKYLKYAAIVLATLLNAALPGYCQTIKWAVKPAYDSIEEFSNDLMMVRKNGRCGLIDLDGKTVVDVYADSITTINNGYALVLEKKEDRFRLVSILDKNNKVVNVKDVFYVKDYAFFSDNRLPVMNAKGLYGFLDENGTNVITCRFASVFPFTEGIASVVKNKGIKLGSDEANKTELADKTERLLNGAVQKFKDLAKFTDNEEYIYIDLKGNTINMPYKMWYASPFSDGKAAIFTKDGERLLIDKDGITLRSLKEDETYEDFVNYAIKVSYQVPSTEYDGPTTFTELNKYGYTYHDKVIVPAQFSFAMPFKYGYAIVQQNGKYGIIKLIGGQCNVYGRYGKIPSANPSYEALMFDIFIPKEWTDIPVTLSCSVDGYDTIEQAQPLTEADGFRKYSMQVPKGTKIFTISADGLVLWNSYMAEEKIIAGNSASAVENVSVSLNASTVRADVNDRARVSLNVVNAGDEDIEAITVVVTGSSISTISKTEPLANGEELKIPVSFNLKGVASTTTREIKVALTVAGNANTVFKTFRITLKPFFE